MNEFVIVLMVCCAVAPVLLPRNSLLWYVVSLILLTILAWGVAALASGMESRRAFLDVILTGVLILSLATPGAIIFLLLRLLIDRIPDRRNKT